ncbi:NADH-quinone oxidoreductase subunit NuoH [Haloechinothrix salitolerans]
MLLPVALGALVLGMVSGEAAVDARTAGRRVTTGELTRPVRGAARLLMRQRRLPLRADAVLWRIGSAAGVVAAVLAAAVVPFGGYVVWDSAVGIVWFNAMGALMWALAWLAGWGANSAHALVGGYRFLAQALAYELPLMFALTAPALGAASLRMGDVVAAQQDVWFVVWMPLAFAVYLLGVLGISFWGPLAPPAGSDIASGIAAEQSGMDRLALLAGRGMLLVTGAAFAVPLFLGGGGGPVLPGWLWSLLKTVAVLAVLVWLSVGLPRVAVPRLLRVGWVMVLPAVLAQLLVVGVVVAW